MDIALHEITIRELVEGYTDNQEDGVFAYGGKLSVRPPYQREFVYKEKERNAVIDTVRKGYPLNTMYWMVAEKDNDGNPTKLELLDGQQRTISICQYVNNDYSVDFRYFFNLTDDEKNQFLDYKLMIYWCEGSDSERLAWFRTINTGGLKLEQQELRNAVYVGPWLTNAKRYFSKTGCPAIDVGGKYLTGNANRQAFLETALKWITQKDGKEIEDYMAEHQQDANANALWTYFNGVIEWVKATFPKYRSIQKGINWGEIYEEHKDKVLDIDALEARIKELLEDDDVTNNKGVYAYVLDGKEKHLNIRAFTPSQKRAAYERQNGVCPICGKHFDIEEMEGDHITPWHDGGKTTQENCQMLCKECNRAKGGQ